MKKLCLIIPPLFKKQWIIVSLIILIPLVSRADRYGCYVENYSFYIFHNQYAAMGGHPNYLFSSNDNNNPDTYYVKDGRCPLVKNTVCYLYNYNGTLRATGYATDFDINNCPIDDYIPLFAIFAAGIAFIFLKRKEMQSINENNHHHRRL